MVVRYIEDRYKVEDSYTIHDSEQNKYICVCATHEIARHIAILLNEEPIGKK